MKNFVIIFIFLLAVNLLVPVGYAKIYTRLDKIDTGEKTEEYVQPRTSDETVVLFDKSTDSLIEVELVDYLVGAAACEMPALYEAEAIKAQMIAIHSYYRYCLDHPEYLDGGYITVNEEKMLGYTSKTRLTEYWGMSFYDYYNKFLRCANEICDEILTYDGQAALTTYYAVSCGKTCSSRDLWGQELEYLTSVDSSFDAVSDNYLKIKEFEVNELYTVLKSTFPFLEITEGEPEKWFGDIIYLDSGYAKYVPVGIDKIPGDQFRDALGLPSSCVMVFLEDDVFSVATKGYGHGVGMSQFGANQLSQQGKNYKEILLHYYPNTVLKEI